MLLKICICHLHSFGTEANLSTRLHTTVSSLAISNLSSFRALASTIWSWWFVIIHFINLFLTPFSWHSYLRQFLRLLLLLVVFFFFTVLVVNLYQLASNIFIQLSAGMHSFICMFSQSIVTTDFQEGFINDNIFLPSCSLSLFYLEKKKIAECKWNFPPFWISSTEQ